MTYAKKFCQLKLKMFWCECSYLCGCKYGFRLIAVRNRKRIIRGHAKKLIGIESLESNFNPQPNDLFYGTILLLSFIKYAEVNTEYLLVHLATHLTYRLRQTNYRRRPLEK